MSKKNILIITPIYPPDIGGPASYVSNLIEKLPRGVNSKVITFAKKESIIKIQESRIIKISLNPNPVSRQFKLFKAILKQLSWADICYAQGTLTVGLATLFSCKLKNKPYIIKYVGDEVWEEYQTCGGKLGLEEFLKTVISSSLHQRINILEYLINKIKYSLSKIILKNAREVITPGKYLQEVLRIYYQINSLNIPNAIEISEIQNTKYKKQNTIVCIGRLVPWKNIDLVVEAFKIINKRNERKNPYHLMIIGDGPEMPDLKSKVNQLELNSSVTFTGKLSKAETQQHMIEAEFIVLYSSYEGLSHALLEAMISKTKIVASNIKANSDLLEDGKLGKLVELNDPEKLAQEIIVSYPSSIVRKAYKQVTSKYSWENHINQLLKFL